MSSEPDAWQAYIARKNAAQSVLRGATAPARAILDEAKAAYREAAAPAQAEFDRECRAAWDEYKARVAAEDASVSA